MEMVVPITDKVFIFVGRKSPIPRLQLKKVLKFLSLVLIWNPDPVYDYTAGNSTVCTIE